jgi:general secretion pathway protein G
VKKETRRGFTFVELLVVITIIAVLAGVAVVSFVNTNQRSRDSRRRLDIENIRSALELCRTENGSYPLSIYDDVVCGGETYLVDTSRDPKYDAPDDAYDYTRSSETSYSISCTLESGESCVFVNP